MDRPSHPTCLKCGAKHGAGTILYRLKNETFVCGRHFKGVTGVTLAVKPLDSVGTGVITYEAAQHLHRKQVYVIDSIRNNLIAKLRPDIGWHEYGPKQIRVKGGDVYSLHTWEELFPNGD